MYSYDRRASTQRVEKVRQALSDFLQMRSFPGPSWDGIEAFHNTLASVVDSAAVEVAGWYKYTASTRSDMDGKDWRIVLPDEAGAVSINCHSLLHDDQWTLVTSIYHTSEIELSKLRFLHHPTASTRALMWTLAVARGLATQGYGYTEVIEGFEQRLRPF